MNKIIVAVFDSEEKANEGLNALRKLHVDGDITLYAHTVISKDDKGGMSVNKCADSGPIGVSVEMFSETLIGLVAGPAGRIVGSMLGSFGGLIYEVGQTDFEVDFVNEVSAAIQPGKIAVIVEAEEVWTIPVDTRMEALGAAVFRRNKNEVVENQLDQEAKQTIAEIKELKKERKYASDEMKESIQEIINKVRQKQHVLKVLVDVKIKDIKDETDAKYSKLKHQIKHVRELKKKKLDKRMTALKTNYEKRKKNLEKTALKISENITCLNL